MTFESRRALLPGRIANKLLLIACLLVLCIILVAGLSPFTPHLPNEVRWLEHENGLYFGEYATILSNTPLRLDGPQEGPCSVELWVQPGFIDDSNTMLAFQTPQTPLQFRIQQNNDALMFTRQTVGPDGQINKRLIYIHQVLRRDTPILITVTAGSDGTNVYLDGRLARSSKDFGLTRHDLNGGIVVGNSPVINDSWSGILRGIGVYNQALTLDEVNQDFEDWKRSAQPRDLHEKRAVAVYAFTERSGKVTHSQVATGVDLTIPNYYLVLYPPFLQPFWKHWGWNWGFWKDGIINVTGFIPFGFVFCAYFSLYRRVGRAILLTVIFGCAISFIIEATQYYLPTRDSDSMDFINNTLGTVIGAVSYRPRFVQKLLEYFGIVNFQNRQAVTEPAESLSEAI
jgi:hypothetical protein